METNITKLVCEGCKELLDRKRLLLNRGMLTTDESLELSQLNNMVSGWCMEDQNIEWCKKEYNIDIK